MSRDGKYHQGRFHPQNPQTVPPKQKSRVTKSYLYEIQTYAVNQSKWNAADEWCKDRKLEFKVITEQELFGEK